MYIYIPLLTDERLDVPLDIQNQFPQAASRVNVKITISNIIGDIDHIIFECQLRKTKNIFYQKIKTYMRRLRREIEQGIGDRNTKRDSFIGD